MSKIDRTLAGAVRRRANGTCEYCGSREDVAELRFQIDHVMALQHRGPTALDNPALAGGFCNRHKGPNLTGVDPETGAVVLLYHPRRDSWADPFRRAGVQIIGVTPDRTCYRRTHGDERPRATTAPRRGRVNPANEVIRT